MPFSRLRLPPLRVSAMIFEQPLTLCILLKSLMCEFPIDSDLKAMSYIKHVQNK